MARNANSIENCGLIDMIASNMKPSIYRLDEELEIFLLPVGQNDVDFSPECDKMHVWIFFIRKKLRKSERFS